MIEVKSVDTLCEIISGLDARKIDYQIFASSKETQGPFGFFGSDKSKPLKATVKLLVLSAIGQFYFSDRFDNKEKADECLSKFPSAASYDFKIIKAQGGENKQIVNQRVVIE